MRSALISHAGLAYESPTVKSLPALSLLLLASHAAAVDFVQDIQPIFSAHCYKCHGPHKQEAAFRLDHKPTALKGGEDGKVIEPGDSAKSMLVHNVARIGEEDDWMPPKDNKANIPALNPGQVSLIRAWIDQGAK